MDPKKLFIDARIKGSPRFVSPEVKAKTDVDEPLDETVIEDVIP